MGLPKNVKGSPHRNRSTFLQCEAVGGEEEERDEVIHEVVVVMKYMRTGT